MQIYYSKNVLRQLKKLPRSELKKVVRQMERLMLSPFAGKKLEGELTNSYSLKAWPYRIIYSINKQKKAVFIKTIEHRQGVYK